MAFSPPLAADRHVGRVLKATYLLEAKVGVGGFGAVYRARHNKLGSAVAVKFLLPHADDLARQRFEREARISASIVHPNVARVIDIDHDDEGSPYMVMEWCEGASLRAVLAERGCLNFHETLELFSQFCSAMEAAHAKGVVHRDLKPENLLLSDESNVIMLKVLDFGIARMIGSAGTLTHGVAIGTPCYMAPESARVGSASADRRVDVYAMGLLLYECLTGVKAIDGEPMDIFARQLTGNVVIPSVVKLKPYLPVELDAVIARACAREPAERFQTAAELDAALDVVEPPLTERGILTGERPPATTIPTGRGQRALSPASLTPAGPVAVVGRNLRTPTPEPTPLPPHAPAQPSVSHEVSSLSLAAVAFEALDAHEAPRPRWRTFAIFGALLVATGVGTYFLVSSATVDSSLDKVKSSGARPVEVSTVQLQLKGVVPTGVRVYDLEHPAVPLVLHGSTLTLPRSTHPLRLRFEAPGYEKITMEVIPEADGDINLGGGK